MFYYVQEVGYFKAAKPYYTERENLPSYLMKFTLSGKGTLKYADKTYTLEKGDLFFIDCMDYQHYYTESDEPWEMDWIHFQGPNVDKFYQEYLKNGTHCFHTDSLRIHEIILQILSLQTHTNARTEYAISVKIHELLNELVIQKNQLTFEEEDIPDYIQKLQIFLDEHYREKITLDFLEKKYMVNKYQLNKEFSKYIGVPPNDYLITNRINRSKNLLRFTNASINEIAYEIGIENVPYFCRLFKTKTGMTPVGFRKNG